jgi:hypothetical protein
VLKKEDENILRRVERKIIGKICGPIQEEEQWTIRNNEEMDEILKKEDIVRFITARRIDWLGHVERMYAIRMPWLVWCVYITRQLYLQIIQYLIHFFYKVFVGVQDQDIVVNFNGILQRCVTEFHVSAFFYFGVTNIILMFPLQLLPEGCA